MFNRRTILSLAFTALCLPEALAQAAKIKVVASFSILGDLVSQVAGDRIALTTLVKPGSDAHVYVPTVEDAKIVANADLFFSNGLQFESWLKGLMQASASKAKIVEASAGIKPNAIKSAGHHHGHSHGHSHGKHDPHAWQAVENVKKYVVTIRDALIARDADGKASYEANAARYLTELDQLEKDIKTAIAAIPPVRRKVITSHDAFGYFQSAYGLEFIAPRGISTQTEASAKDAARIIQQIRREKITAVFIENLTDQRLMQQIAKETGAKIGGSLFSDTLSAADGPASTYISMMRHNIKVISEALLST
jgi:zinc/manganese transport system substrate-binding protein